MFSVAFISSTFLFISFGLNKNALRIKNLEKSVIILRGNTLLNEIYDYIMIRIETKLDQLNFALYKNITDSILIQNIIESNKLIEKSYRIT